MHNPSYYKWCHSCSSLPVKCHLGRRASIYLQSVWPARVTSCDSVQLLLQAIPQHSLMAPTWLG